MPLIRNDARETQHRRKSNNKFAAVLKSWDKRLKILTNLFNSELYVTAHEQLITFRCKCTFGQYMLIKPVWHKILDFLQ